MTVRAIVMAAGLAFGFVLVDELISRWRGRR